MITGKHLISGQWHGGDETFQSTPVRGEGHQFCVGTETHIERAVQAGEQAFEVYGWLSDQKRAYFIRKIAEEIEIRAADITQIGSEETGLPNARLEGERGRTVGQLRMFADHIEKGEYLDKRHDPALPDRLPLPRPDLYLQQRPLGPVAVFGASNFPLAFSAVGGDTASALAAGCPVIVKGHEAHPGTSEVMAQAVCAAIEACDMPKGVFSLIQGGSQSVGKALVTHPLIRAVGFTGSLAGGRVLFDLCAQRAEPIPFFGELGSVNPMFILPHALKARTGEIATGWAGSLTMGVGQFCTNPGLAIVMEGSEADTFSKAVQAGLVDIPEQVMLTEGIARAYSDGCRHLQSNHAVKMILDQPASPATSSRYARVALFETDGNSFLQDPALSEEIFGPSGMIVRVSSLNQMLEVGRKLQGQLTCSLHMEAADMEAAAQLLPIVERKAGRILANGFPTGVEVCDAMVHGGPYPASTNFGATSVGTMALRRFMRPVSYQNMPKPLLMQLSE